jgi:hypothetical protein
MDSFCDKCFSYLISSEYTGPRTITGIDPGVRNFSLYRYDILKDSATHWMWVDLKGCQRSKISSAKIVERLCCFMEHYPEAFDSDMIVVERQMKINVSNQAIQDYLEKVFREGPQTFVVECPKVTKSAILEMLLSHHICPHREIPTPSVVNRYGFKEEMTKPEKKNAYVRLGKVVMNGKERKMEAALLREKKLIGGEYVKYDKKMIASGRTKAEKPRATKGRPDDPFDSKFIALCKASELTKINIIQKRLLWRQIAQ